ncbi:MAG: hypothetical protein HZC04_01470 [Candidatus Lloydbacteria bacterium]|nr:hypothetical protein [Candidatus Lloydbacteria bacterium]
MKPLTKKILMACAVLSVIVFACDIKKEKVSALISNASHGISVVGAQAKPVVRPEDRAWRLCWRMPPSAKSSLGIREKCSPAKIVRLDEAYFTITANYEHQWQKHQAVLNWEKAKDEKGYWSQPAPKLSGTWALTMVSPDLYNGWYHDNKGGEDGVMWLQAVK